MKLIITVLAILSLPVLGLSQKNNTNTINLYLQNSYSDDSSYVKKISLVYDLYYPVYTPITTWIPLDREKKILTIKISNNYIVLDGKSILVENGDTIYTRVENRDGHIIFTNRNNPSLFYDIQKQSDFNKKNKLYPTDILNDSAFSYPSYRDYCVYYFTEERKFINDFFKHERLNVKSRLISTSENYQLVCLILPFIDGRAIEQNYKNWTDSTLGAELKRLNHFQSGYMTDPSYRYALSQMNFYLTNINGNRIVTPNEYLKLYNNAKKIFSKKTFEYLMMGYLRNIVRTGNTSYQEILNIIYRELYVEISGSKEREIIDSLYNFFQIFSTNLKFFKDVEIKNPQGEKMYLDEILKETKPVLLDFWATWCAPCIVELPYLDSVRKRFPEIQVISLSIDQDESKWFKFFNKNELLRSSSYLLVNQKESKLVKKYQIKSVPKFILYNKEGDCLSLDLTRPSERTFSITMKRLLGEN